jgi:hypothetical protein
VRSSRTILTRKIYAAFLLLLFTLIYSGKAIHTHEQHPNCSTETGITATTSTVLCAICEFQISKDLELPVIIEGQKIFYTGSIEFVFSSLDVLFSLQLQLKDRAPPVLS